jgi:hypothetical protein
MIDWLISYSVTITVKSIITIAAIELAYLMVLIAFSSDYTCLTTH